MAIKGFKLSSEIDDDRVLEVELVDETGQTPCAEVRIRLDSEEDDQFRSMRLEEREARELIWSLEGLFGMRPARVDRRTAAQRREARIRAMDEARKG